MCSLARLKQVVKGKDWTTILTWSKEGDSTLPVRKLEVVAKRTCPEFLKAALGVGYCSREKVMGSMKGRRICGKDRESLNVWITGRLPGRSVNRT